MRRTLEAYLSITTVLCCGHRHPQQLVQTLSELKLHQQSIMLTVHYRSVDLKERLLNWISPSFLTSTLWVRAPRAPDFPPDCALARLLIERG